MIVDDLTVQIKGNADDYRDALKKAEVDTNTFSHTLEGANKKLEESGTKGEEGFGNLSSAVFQGMLSMEAFEGAIEVVNVGLEFLSESLEKFNERQHIALGLNQQYVEAYESQAVELERATNLRADDTLKLIGQAEAMGVSGEAAIQASREAAVLAESLGISSKRAIRFTAALAQGSTELIDNYLPALKNTEKGAERVAKAHELIAEMYGDVARQSHSNIGETERYNNALDDLQVTIGELLSGPGASWTKWATESVSALNDLIKSLGETDSAMGKLGEAPEDKVSGKLAGGFGLQTDYVGLSNKGPAAIAGDMLLGKTDISGDVGRIVGGTYGRITNQFNQTSSGLRGPSEEALKYSQGDPDAAARNQIKARMEYEQFQREKKTNPDLLDKIGGGISKGASELNNLLNNFDTRVHATGIPVYLDKINKKFEEANDWAKKYHETVLDEGKKVTDRYKTPFEKEKETLENLNRLLKEGGIDQETYGRAVAGAAEDRAKAEESAQRKEESQKEKALKGFTKPSESGIQGLRAGSAEAIASIQARIGGNRISSDEDKQKEKLKAGTKEGSKEGILEGLQEFIAGIGFLPAGLGNGG